jgi:hypothetical protein
MAAGGRATVAAARVALAVLPATARSEEYEADVMVGRMAAAMVAVVERVAHKAATAATAALVAERVVLQVKARDSRKW